MLSSLKRFCLSQWGTICPDLPRPKGIEAVAYLPAGRIIHPKFIFLIFTENRGEPVLVAKIPTSPHYTPTIKSAFEMLKEFYRSPRLKDLAHTVPRPVYEGKIQGFPLFLESYCSGRILPLKGFHFRYAPFRCFRTAAEWLKQFHMRTKVVTKGVEEIYRHFLALIEESTLAFPELKEKLKPLQEKCLSFVNKPIPLVYSHGDYTAKNILFGSDAENVRIIDWERHQRDDLPFFDMLKFSLWFICGRKGGSLFEGLQECFFKDRRVKTVIEDYLSTLEIEEDLKRILIPLYLVKRIGAIQRNIGREAARGYLSCLSMWLDFTRSLR